MCSSENQRPTLLACLGHNPASIIVAARQTGAAKLVAVATADTRERLPILERQLRVPVQAVFHDETAEGFEALSAAIHATLIGQGSGRLIVDVTGGTKIMGIAALRAAERIDPNAEVLYLHPQSRLADARSGRLQTSEVVVDISEVLEWYGAEPSVQLWSGPLSALPAGYAERAVIAQRIFETLAAGQLHRVKGSAQAVALNSGRWPERLPEGFMAQGTVLRSKIDGYFSANAWLEEFCLYRAAQVLADLPTVRAAAGLKLRSGRPSPDLDEVDCVLVDAARVCVIEAKARFSSSAAGAGLQKRIHKARRFFGSTARVIFVHPAWSKTAPLDLIKSSGRDVWLVGGCVKTLDQALAEAMGLTGHGQRLRPGALRTAPAPAPSTPAR